MADEWGAAGAGAASGAATGAAVGILGGPLGTAIGAGAGALVGGAVGYFSGMSRSRAAKARQREYEAALAAAFYRQQELQRKTREVQEWQSRETAAAQQAQRDS